MPFKDLNFLDPIQKEQLLKLASDGGISSASILGAYFEEGADYPRIVYLLEGKTYLIRFLDDIFTFRSEHLAKLEYFLKRWAIHQPELELSWDFLGDKKFLKRRFFQTLADPGSLAFEKVLAAFQRYQKVGLLHGHLTPSNIAILEGQIIFLDPCVSALIPWYQSEYLCPEGGLSFKGDFYSLGKFVSKFPNLPPNVSFWVMQCLNTDPAKRPASVLNFELASSPENPVRRNSAGLIITLILLSLGLFVGFYFLSNKSNDGHVIEKPSISQAELKKAIEAGDMGVLKAVGDYLVLSGDRAFFLYVLSFFKSLEKSDFLNVELAKRLSDLKVASNFTEADVMILSNLIFYKVISPNLIRAPDLTKLGEAGVLVLSAISTQDDLGLAKLNLRNLTVSDERLARVVKFLIDNGVTNPAHSAFRLVTKVFLDFCSDFKNEISSLEPVFTIVLLRVLIDNELINVKCAESLLQNLELSFKALIDWFNESSLVDWKQLNSLYKLKIVAGTLPELPADYYLDLIKFPLSELSHESFNRVETMCVEDSCKKSFPVIFRFKDLMRREQLVSLGSLILAGTQPAKQFVTAWFNLKPNPNLVLELVLARDLDGSKDVFTQMAISFLLAREFNLTTESKIKLCSHPDSRARRLCLIKLDPKLSNDRKILERSLEFETDEDNKKIIKQKLAVKVRS